jgi:riboflavin kinase/FMN adenylyltransferase
LLDALTKQRGEPLWKFFGGAGTTLETDMTVTTGTATEAADNARAIRKRGIRMIKVKVGGKLGPAHDLERVGAISEVAPDSPLILDGNAGVSRAAASELVRGLKARYVLVGDDFSFGARRGGNYALLDAAGAQAGFDVARMMSYEVHGLRVSSSAVRQALAEGDMDRAAALLGRSYAISGRAVHGRKLGRELGFRTLNLRFVHPRPAAMGIFVARIHGLGHRALPGVASLGVRPTVEDAGRVLLETHALEWPQTLGLEGGYGRCLRVELAHKLHDERRYASLEALQQGIAQDVADARAWFAAR